MYNWERDKCLIEKTMLHKLGKELNARSTANHIICF